MRCDIAVVGGGIMGTMLAWFAAQRWPSWSLRLIERHRVGGGASAASAGFDAIESAHPALRDLALRSRALYGTMSRRIRAAAVRRVRTLWVVPGTETATFVQRFAGTRLCDGSVRLVAASELPRGFERLHDERVFATTSDGYAQPGAICRDIVETLRREHADFMLREGATVVAATPQTDGCRLELGDGSTLHARHAVIAAGADLADANRSGWPRLRLRRKKVAMLHLDVAPDPGAQAVVYGARGAFFLPRSDRGQWHFGYTLDSWDERAARTPDRLDADELALGRQLLGELGPDWTTRVLGADVACDAYAENGVPLCCAASAPLYVIGAGSGAGYRCAPALAEQAVDAIAAHERRTA